MSKPNKNNSIIFLTTLSVYLGLVLVGGAPSVLAQAATTRNFNVQDEVEIKDDLDKKPEDFTDEKNQSLKFGNRVILDYAEVVAALLEASRQANPNEFSFASETKSDFADKLQIKKISFTKLDNQELESRQIFHNIDSASIRLFNLFPAQKSYDESNVIVNFQSNGKEFTAASKFFQNDNSDAQKLVSAYNSSLEFLAGETANRRQVLILKHTEILAENNQFVIITRLPRGSLDELLKQDAKAENE